MAAIGRPELASTGEDSAPTMMDSVSEKFKRYFDFILFSPLDYLQTQNTPAPPSWVKVSERRGMAIA
jgi:hypothetical protein